MQGASAAVLGTDGHRRLCRHEGVAYMEMFGPPLIFLTPNVADTQHPLLLVVQGETIDLGQVTEELEPALPKYRDMLRKLAADPVAQTVQFELLMRLFLQHVLNVRPETVDCRRGSARVVSREWCSDGAAASSSGCGLLGPVLAFRGEIEAQGRGSLHPHILVWLVCGHLEVMGQLAELLKNDKQELQKRLRHFMQMVVASFESISHASVQAAPRLFDGESLSRAVGVSKVARNLCKFDGGSDLELLESMPERTDAQNKYLETADPAAWRRPVVEVEELSAGANSIFSQSIQKLVVARTPLYRLRGGLVDGTSPEEDAQGWQKAFAQDLHNLAPALLKHVCSDSCYKYSDSGSTRFRICRHGFYHVVEVFEGCRVRRKGKALRPCIHIGSEAENEYGMEGRLRPFQLTPFECQTSYGGLVAGRHNLDLQDMRRVLDPGLWIGEDDHLPHVGVTDAFGYMAKYEWVGSNYEERPSAPVAPVSWLECRSHAKSFRAGWLDAHAGAVARMHGAVVDKGESVDEAFVKSIRCGINESFCDGINSGFYINSYTTKPGPGLAGMLEELQRGGRL
eukprot:Skav230578  [mRNA]  locus=scaffold1455:7449:9152:+ [translate_table: standard]